MDKILSALVQSNYFDLDIMNTLFAKFLLNCFFPFTKCMCGGGCCVPGGASGKESACQGRSKRRKFYSWVGKIPWRRAWQPTPVFLPGESHGQRSLAGYGQ